MFVVCLCICYIRLYAPRKDKCRQTENTGNLISTDNKQETCYYVQRVGYSCQLLDQQWIDILMKGYFCQFWEQQGQQWILTVETLDWHNCWGIRPKCYFSSSEMFSCLSCYGALSIPCHNILQQWWLISFDLFCFLLVFYQKSDITLSKYQDIDIYVIIITANLLCYSCLLWYWDGWSKCSMS